MKQRPRIYYSEAQKAQMWARWKEGWTMHQIAQLFDRGHSSIHESSLSPVASSRRSDVGPSWR